jgi:hypothetical protein
MTTTWKIIDTKRQVSDGLIVEITYACEARLASELSRTLATINVAGDSLSPNFIAFSDLTEQIILQWVKSTLGQQQVDEIETNIQNAVTAIQAAKDAATIKNGLPWSMN